MVKLKRDLKRDLSLSYLRSKLREYVCDVDESTDRDRCSSGRLISTSCGALDLLLSGREVWLLELDVNGKCKSRYYTSCSRSSYDGSQMCWKHSNTCNSKSMIDITSHGRLCEVKDFTKKVKSRRLSRVIPSLICGDFPSSLSCAPLLRLYITENIKLKMSEMCRISVDDESDAIITKRLPSSLLSSTPPRPNI